MHTVNDCDGYVNRVDRGYSTDAEKVVGQSRDVGSNLKHRNPFHCGQAASGSLDVSPGDFFKHSL